MRRLAAATAFGLLAVPAYDASAADFTWVGGGANVNWSTAANWSPGVPANNTATDLFFQGITNTGTAGTPLNQNISTGGSAMTINSMTFQSTAGTFFLGGNGFDIDNGVVITQSSSNAQSIANGFIGSINSQTNLLTLSGNGTGVVTLSGVLQSGTGNRRLGLSKTGSSTYVLSGNNTYTGGSTISAGTVRAMSASALGSTGGNLTLSGGTLDLSINSSISSYNTAVSGNTTIVSNRSTAGAGITHTFGTLGIGANTLNITAGSNVTSGTAEVAFGATTLSGNNAIFDVATGSELTLGGLSGNFSFTKQNSGQLTLSGASSRTGGAVTVSDGTLRLGNASALGTDAVPLQINGGALHLADDTSVNAHDTTISADTMIVSDRSSAGAGVTHTLGTLALAGNSLNITAGSNVSSGTAGVAFGATALSSDAAFNIGSNASLTLGALNDSGTARNLTKSGSGALTLTSSATSLVEGTTLTITSGTVNSNASGALGSLAEITLSSGATLNLGASQAIAALNSAVSNTGAVNLNSNNLTIGSAVNNLPGNFAGVISGDGGSITKAGSANLTFSGTNTYTGNTNINAGTFTLLSTAALPSSVISIASGANFDVTDFGMSGFTIQVAQTLAGNGTVHGATVIEGVLSPGVSPGALTLGNTDLAGGGSYTWEINNQSGTGGVNWDEVAMQAVNVTASVGDKFNIRVVSLNASNVPGAMTEGAGQAWDPDTGQSWVIATFTSGIDGSILDRFGVDLTQFQNTTKAPFYLTASGGELRLNYVPEPTSGLLLCAGAVLARRQRRTRTR